MIRREEADAMPRGTLFSKMSLRQMLVFFFLVSLMLMFLMLYLSSLRYSAVIRNKTEQGVNLYVSEQERQLSDELLNIHTSLFSFANKQEVADYLSNGTGYRAQNNGYISSLLKDMLSYVPAVKDAVLLTPDGRQVAITNNNSYDILNFVALQDTIIRNQWPENLGDYMTLRPVNNEGYLLVVTAPVLLNVKTRGLAAVFCTADSLLGNMRLSESDFAVYLDGEKICGKGSMLPDTEAEAAEMKGVVSFVNRMTGWHVFMTSPMSAQGDITTNEAWIWNLSVLIVFLIIEFILLICIYKTILAPIGSISLQSTKINSSAVQIDNPAPKRKELSNLVTNINTMVCRTNQLTEEREAAEMKLLEMEIANLKEKSLFLQAQINPHFLYNMMECICGMASEGRNDMVAEVTGLLGKLYRYCVQSGEAWLYEELESVEIFDRIIRMRYPGGCRIESRIEGELELLPMPRMVLEPLVENAVQHGFEQGRSEQFHVIVSGRMRSDVLEMTVEDNGCGMPAEKMEMLNAFLRQEPFAAEPDEKHIGIRNVNTRLRLMYGEGSGLQLKRNEKGGVTVYLTIHYQGVNEEDM